MKNSISVLGMVLLGLATFIFLAGCAGMSANPAPNPAPTSPAHGTFVFVSGGNFIDPMFGYRLNPDGTLTPIPGSPFPFSGEVSASGSFLISVGQGSLISYRVDPVTGVPTQAASAAVPEFTDALGGDAHNVYVAGADAAIGTFIYGFSLADSGTFTPVPGSPYIFGGPCDQCPFPLFPNLTLNNNFFALSVEGYRGTGGISVFRRDSKGSLTPGGFAGFEGVSAAALQPRAGNVVFSLSGGIISYQLDPNGTPRQTMTLDPGIDAIDETVDATGRFLLVLDNPGAVHVFAIDSATAGFNQIGSSESVGDGANLIAMDPSGRFVIVAQSSEGGFLSTPDRITVFTFDPASGAIKKLQSYPMDKSPFRIAFVSQ